jgi:hypothetical protein
VKLTYKKNASCLEILENSYGGAFPSALTLEAPPNISIKIREESFIQFLFKCLGILRGFRVMYCHSLRLMSEFAVSASNTGGFKNKYLISTLSHIAAIFIYLRLFGGQFEKPHDYEYGRTSPFTKNRIYLISKNIYRENKDVYKTISHENIHILQCHNGDFDFENRLFERQRAKQYCRKYLRSDIKSDGYLEYLFEKVEVEARVHELVSAFYIETQFFPVTREELLVCLFYSNDVLEHLHLTLGKYHPKSKTILSLLNDISDKAIAYSISSPIKTSTDATVDFSVIFNSINNTDQLFDFIKFELPRYFCNVLNLYGARSISLKLQNEIIKEREILG